MMRGVFDICFEGAEDSNCLMPCDVVLLIVPVSSVEYPLCGVEIYGVDARGRKERNVAPHLFF